MATQLKHIVVGPTSYDLASEPEPQSIIGSMLSPDIVDGVTIVINENDQLSIGGGDEGIGVITASMLAPDVWERVNDIMDEGFGDILDGSY